MHRRLESDQGRRAVTARPRLLPRAPRPVRLRLRESRPVRPRRPAVGRGSLRRVHGRGPRVRQQRLARAAAPALPRLAADARRRLRRRPRPRSCVVRGRLVHGGGRRQRLPRPGLDRQLRRSDLGRRQLALRLRLPDAERGLDGRERRQQRGASVRPDGGRHDHGRLRLRHLRVLVEHAERRTDREPDGQPEDAGHRTGGDLRLGRVVRRPPAGGRADLRVDVRRRLLRDRRAG